jgi:hypothetical protein
MPTLVGTLLADAHDLDVLAGTTAGNFPFEAFYVAGIDVLVPISEVFPTEPEDWIRGTRWRAIRGTRWTSVHGSGWDPVRGTRWPSVSGTPWPEVSKE